MNTLDPLLEDGFVFKIQTIDFNGDIKTRRSLLRCSSCGCPWHYPSSYSNMYDYTQFFKCEDCDKEHVISDDESTTYKPVDKAPRRPVRAHLLLSTPPEDESN